MFVNSWCWIWLSIFIILKRWVRCHNFTWLSKDAKIGVQMSKKETLTKRVFNGSIKANHLQIVQIDVSDTRFCMVIQICWYPSMEYNVKRETRYYYNHCKASLVAYSSVNWLCDMFVHDLMLSLASAASTMPPSSLALSAADALACWSSRGSLVSASASDFHERCIEWVKSWYMSKWNQENKVVWIHLSKNMSPSELSPEDKAIRLALGCWCGVGCFVKQIDIKTNKETCGEHTEEEEEEKKRALNFYLQFWSESFQRPFLLITNGKFKLLASSFIFCCALLNLIDLL